MAKHKKTNAVLYVAVNQMTDEERHAVSRFHKKLVEDVKEETELSLRKIVFVLFLIFVIFFSFLSVFLDITEEDRLALKLQRQEDMRKRLEAVKARRE
ncbi:MAG: hypothetical protein IPG34_00380 [Rhodocyclaceae bacterium]|jgi:type VI protein secretion system component VasF|nr:hypothetical protein [Rhodocyclaceae bacterium]